MNPHQIYAQRFAAGNGTKRSLPFRAGCLALLLERAAGKRGTLKCPHEPGSTAFDAWFAGVEEGHHLYDRHHPRNLPLRTAA